MLHCIRHELVSHPGILTTRERQRKNTWRKRLGEETSLQRKIEDDIRHADSRSSIRGSKDAREVYSWSCWKQTQHPSLQCKTMDVGLSHYVAFLFDIYTVFHKRCPFYFFIIHSNNDQFTQHFYQM